MPQKPADGKTAFLTLRLPLDVKEALRQQAEINTRSLGAQALHLIKQGLKAQPK
jgi:hypothetical protein